MKHRVQTGLVMLALVLTLCVSPAGFADNHAKPPNIASVWIMTPADGVSQAAMEEAVKTHMAWRLEAGDPRRWQAYVVHAGSDMNQIWVRACCFNWADQDAYEQWTYDSGAYAAYQEQLGGMVGKIEHRYQEIDTENTKWNSDREPYYYIGVTKWTPNPAKIMQMMPAVSEMSQFAIEKQWNYSWAWYRSLGEEDNLHLAVPYNNFAGMEPPEMSFFEFAAGHMGQEAATAMFQRFNESFWTSTYTIYRWREDLSMPRGDD